MTENNAPQTITVGQKWASLILGGAMLLGGIVGLASLLRDSVALIFTPPQQVTFVQASEIATEDNTYVELQDAVYLCDRLEHREGPSSSTSTTEIRYTDIWLTDEARTVAVFATFSGRHDCEWVMNRELSGYLRTAERLPRTAGLPPLSLRDDIDYLELCGYCGRSNSLAAIVGMSILMLLGGVFTYSGLSRPVGPAPE